jgi:hypothetical protein
MPVALYLLYRIAYPKQANAKKSDDKIVEQATKITHNVMGKSRFVLPDRSQYQQSSATISKTENVAEKEDIFAAESEDKPLAIIPPEELDEVFDENVNPEIMSIPLAVYTDEIDFEEEAEELNRTTGQETVFAEGFDYDELQTVAKAVKEQPEEVSEKTAEMVVSLKHTDIFEQIVNGDEGKMIWIKTIIDRHVQSTMPEMEDKEINTDYGDFEVSDFLS